MLSFRHEVFIEVATLLSFTKASQVLNLSQPAISKHIKSLEELYRNSLFERAGNRIQLTRAGEILLHHLLEAKEIQKKLEFELSAFQDEYHARGELKLGASTTVALYIIPGLLSGFLKKHPSIKISLLNRNSENVINALLNNEIDLGIAEGKNKISAVSYQFFVKIEVIPVCSSKSYLARKPFISLEELKSTPTAFRERGSGTLASVKDALENVKIKIGELKSKIVLGGTEALKNFILEDDCLGFLPVCSVEKELQSGSLVKLQLENLSIHREFYFIQRHGTESDPFNRSFIGFALNRYNFSL